MYQFTNYNRIKKLICLIMAVVCVCTVCSGYVTRVYADETTEAISEPDTTTAESESETETETETESETETETETETEKPTIEESFEQSIAAFPESYRPMLRELHKAHPNWTFVAFNTNLDWTNDVLKNEMKLSRNLMPNKTMGINGKWFRTPTSWKDFEMTGAFNWTGNDWVELCGGGWVQASTGAVAYVMDPRNWLTEENIFQFEMLSFNETYQTYDVLKKMMDNSFMDCDYAVVGGTNNKTYAAVLMEAGQKYGVSPIHLCARLLQEKGRGTYNSSTGRYVLTDKLASGQKGSDGVTYYNFFNIGASGSTAEAVLKNGVAEAQKAGWNTQYKAIMGGASKVSTDYIKIGQDTIYFQKFSVVNPSYYYWKQYMQNLLAPINEGYNVRNAYANNGILDSNFVFRIPIYNNMPEKACPMPNGDGNPNYKLKDISITGTTNEGKSSKLNLTPTFNMDTNTYSIIVPYKMTKVNISATAIASTTSTISGTGQYNLKVGKNSYKIICVSEYGTSKTYTVNITRSEGSTYLTTLSTSIGGFKESFDKTKYEYTMTVDNKVETLDIYYGAESSIAYIEYVNGETVKPCTGGAISGIQLKEGINTITINVYTSATDKSAKRTYKVKITKYTQTIVDFKLLQSNPGTKYINGFGVGDTVDTAKSRMAVTNGSVLIKDSKGNVKSNDAVIGTGDVLCVLDGNGFEYARYTIIIYGDVNGDGKIDLFDFAYVKKMILENKGLTGVYLTAGDTYQQSEGINLFDFAVIKKYILEKTPIPQVRESEATS